MCRCVLICVYVDVCINIWIDVYILTCMLVTQKRTGKNTEKVWGKIMNNHYGFLCIGKRTCANIYELIELQKKVGGSTWMLILVPCFGGGSRWKMCVTLLPFTIEWKLLDCLPRWHPTLVVRYLLFSTVQQQYYTRWSIRLWLPGGRIVLLNGETPPPRSEWGGYKRGTKELDMKELALCGTRTKFLGSRHPASSRAVESGSSSD